MGDDDSCECNLWCNLWREDVAMRRLLSLLRQSQSYCTENECLDTMPGGLPASQEPSSSFMMMFILFAAALMLYFLRPRSLRNRDDTKPRDLGPGPSGTPPTPPPASN